MDYLPTLGEKWPHSRGNLGRSTFWNGPISGAMLVSGRVIECLVSQMIHGNCIFTYIYHKNHL